MQGRRMASFGRLESQRFETWKSCNGFAAPCGGGQVWSLQMIPRSVGVSTASVARGGVG